MAISGDGDRVDDVTIGQPVVADDGGYRGYVLFLLVLVYLFNFVDRQIFSVVLESIKREYHFSDTQLGLLGGIAFGFVYATVGLPLARVADRWNRRNLIAVSLAVWSGMTALCGQATGFVSLFVARMGVGIGEAGGMPPAYSLITDYFPPRRRGFAFAAFNLGIPLGVMVGFLLGGWINQFYGWRSAFLVVGLPGVVLAAVVGLTMREPPRGRFDEAPPQAKPPSILSTVSLLWVRPACRHLCLAASLYALAAWGSGMWQPSFFVRVHGMSIGVAGTWLALVFGVSGALGTIMGGILGDRLVRVTGDARWYPWLSAGGIAISIPFVFRLFPGSSG